MTAIWVSLVGVAIMMVAIFAFFGWLFHSDVTHHFVADHDFISWMDIFQLDGRRFGKHSVGSVERCYRALVGDVRTQLVVERPGLGQGQPHLHRWILVTRAPRSLAFTATAEEVDGTVPQELSELVTASRRDPRIDAVLCGDGLLLVRVTRPKGLEPALGLLCDCIAALRAARS
ncbi:hypothetical protein [Luteococcus sp. OSA5]|uniref:hypothetical protein n=1 Tax=Luteococcus sp. OSA5 TaxID=3401630 RepID=UPI003B428310